MKSRPPTNELLRRGQDVDQILRKPGDFIPGQVALARRKSCRLSQGTYGKLAAPRARLPFLSRHAYLSDVSAPFSQDERPRISSGP